MDEGPRILRLDLTFDMNEELISCQRAAAASLSRILDLTNERKLTIRGLSSNFMIFTNLSPLASPVRVTRAGRGP